VRKQRETVDKRHIVKKEWTRRSKHGTEVLLSRELSSVVETSHYICRSQDLNPGNSTHSHLKVEILVTRLLDKKKSIVVDGGWCFMVVTGEPKIRHKHIMNSVKTK
jgi:hypothetical protein